MTREKLRELINAARGGGDVDVDDAIDAYVAAERRKAAEVAWDACVASIRYEGGEPVEIVRTVNPYRKGGAQ